MPGIEIFTTNLENLHKNMMVIQRKIIKKTAENMLKYGLEHGRCSSCKWWDKDHVTGNDSHDCEHSMVDTDECASNGVQPTESCLGYGTLKTGPEFGCIHWEGK